MSFWQNIMGEKMGKLIIMVGLSGSGKSTIAKKLVTDENVIIISSDAIREELSFYEDQSKNEEVFRIFNQRVKNGLKTGKTVIADATNITIKSRKQIIQIGKRCNAYICAYVVAKRFYDCFVDNQLREHPVPDRVLRKQIMKFQIPFYEEGFDEIIIDKLGYEYFPVYEIANNMDDFDQKTKWHTDTLDKHSEKVFYKFNEKYSNLDLAAIYHDCGKPYCQTFDESGQAHYYGHDSIGAYILMTYFQTATLDDLFLVNYHMMPFNWIDNKTKEKYKKLFGEYKYEMLIFFNKCDRGR